MIHTWHTPFKYFIIKKCNRFYVKLYHTLRYIHYNRNQILFLFWLKHAKIVMKKEKHFSVVYIKFMEIELLCRGRVKGIRMDHSQHNIKHVHKLYYLFIYIFCFCFHSYYSFWFGLVNYFAYKEFNAKDYIEKLHL